MRRLSRARRLSVSTVLQALHQLEDGGLVEARPQSGSFVRHPVARRAQPDSRSTPETPVAVDVSQRLMRALQAGVAAGVAPLAAALPAPGLLPLASLQRLYAGVVRRHPQLLAGGSHINMDEAALVRQLLLRSVSWAGPLAASEFVITNSCTEALALCLRAVTSPGDTVAVESPAYYLMLQLLETLGLKALEIPTDPSRGLSVEALDLATRDSRVAACLLVANASNPLLWIGFVASGRYRSQIALLKTTSSGATHPVTQLVLAEYLESGPCERHLRSLRRAYQRQVDAMRAAVVRYFPAATRITEPQGGFVLWVELPEEIDCSARYEQAIAAGVAYVPGELFSASGMYRNCLRLNCGNPHTPEIDDAVRRLGGLLGR
ncbi:MAG: putative HTH-type transcriptional regulator YjiR [Candidatus Accumulibacter sp. SK-11]|nr:MAG: putative HTH-type transcriptional regulator YjiR [Candidatus Accumulibacter sp. SK-11]